ncbi:alpha/beta hydrolase [Streptomyces sp. NPDC015414]|uniref:alpha/beta hydrolase n=1 Tax=Streptomyces sp. NPDC015414 TaxID=3364957 RepID=UPI0036FA24C8
MNNMSAGITSKIRTAAALAATTAIVAATTSYSFAGESAPQAARSGKKPTVVLVHGTNLDASSWNGVISRLQADGYPVVAVANPLRGLAYDSAYAASVLRSISGPIILAGHSYGTSVANEVALGNSNVKAIVSVAGFLPVKGETTGGLVAKYPGSTLGSTLQKVTYPMPGGGTGTELYVKQDLFPQQFAQDVPLNEAKILAAGQRPVDAKFGDGVFTGAAWTKIPAYDVVTVQDHNIPVAVQRWMVKRAKATAVEVNSSHVAPVSHPREVTDLIERAATEQVSGIAGDKLASTGQPYTTVTAWVAGAMAAVGTGLLVVLRRRRRCA